MDWLTVCKAREDQKRTAVWWFVLIFNEISALIDIDTTGG